LHRAGLEGALGVGELVTEVADSILGSGDVGPLLAQLRLKQGLQFAASSVGRRTSR